MIKVLAVYCKVCDTTIYSRANHDYHHCRCTNEDYSLMVDGGPGVEYVRMGYGNLADYPKGFVLEIDATEGELYEDWNRRQDKFGYIKGNAETQKKRRTKVQSKRKSNRTHP